MGGREGRMGECVSLLLWKRETFQMSKYKSIWVLAVTQVQICVFFKRYGISSSLKPTLVRMGEGHPSVSL